MTFSTGPLSSALSAPPPPLIPLDRITTWKPGVSFNTVPGQTGPGIPTNATQSGSTLTPIGQLATFTGSTVANSTSLTVSGVVGTPLAAGQLVFDAAMSTCFGWIASGSGSSWQFNDNCHMSCSGVSMVTIGNDGDAIQSALTTAGLTASQSSPKYVLLSSALFFAAGNPIGHTASWVTLRGSGQWTGSEITTGQPPPLSPSSTIIWKADTVTTPWGLLAVGFGTNSVQWTNSINLAVDAAKEGTTVQLVSGYGGSVGDLLIIDMVGDSDPLVFFGNRADLSGYFSGSISGSTLTVGTIQNGPIGANMDPTFQGTVVGSTLTITSTSQGQYANNITTFNPFGLSIFDQSNTYYGYVTGGNFPTYSLSQANAGVNISGTLSLGGATPQVNYPIFDGVWGQFYGFISTGTYPNFTLNQPNTGVNLTGVTLGAGGGFRRAFTRQDRPFSQMVRISAISTTSVANDTLTLEAPLHTAFKTAFSAQVASPSAGFGAGVSKYVIGAGVENLTLYAGNGGDGGGNCAFVSTMYSWVKNVQSVYANGTSIGFYNAYRCEMRQSLCWKSSNPNPGGGGYLSGMNNGSADNLFEDNIMWGGNKIIVMRGTGGGNVVGLNYMDDAFGAGYPMSPEAGLNAGHFGGPHQELLEANYTHEYTADSFWGNEVNITSFRNWISGVRAAANINYNFQYDFIATSAATSAGSNVLIFPTDQTNLYNGLVAIDFNQYNAIPILSSGLGQSATTITGLTPSNFNLNTSAASLSGSSTLTFASSPASSGVYVGQNVFDNTNNTNTIAGGTVVTAVGALTVTISNPIGSAGVGNGDSINFKGTKVTLSANVLSPGVANGDNIQFMYVGTLNNYQLLQNGTQVFPFVDSWGRSCNNMQAHCYNLNHVGNVHGYNGIGFLGFNTTAGNYQQVTQTYDDTTGVGSTGTNFDIYNIGAQSDPIGIFYASPNFLTGVGATLLRNGNWHWTVNGAGVPQGQIWYARIGDTGSVSTGPARAIPDSYYQSGRPSWYPSNKRWPPYNPSDGSTVQIPAHDRFQTIAGGLVTPPGNQ